MSETNEFYYLPEELLITYIFSRLPIKSLLRFKSVSKRFNSIISSPYFAKLHLKNSNSFNNNNSHLLINHKTCFLSFHFESFGSENNWDCSPFDDEGDIISDKPGLARIINGNFEVPHSHLFVIGSCDGLVCLKTKSDFMYIWNPTTSEYRKIPFLRQYKKEDAVWGFGCVASDHDYKIVKIRQNTRNNDKTIEIFSSSENSWTISQQKMEGFGERPKLYGLGVSLNDAIYWLYYGTYLYYDRYNRGMRGFRWWIIGFDLVNQKLKRIPLPEGQIDDFRSSPIMYVMEERLCACWEINGNEINGDHVIEIATLKEEGSTSSWIKLYQLGHSYNIVPWYLSYKPKSVPNITTKTRFAIEVFSSNIYAYDRGRNCNPPAPDTLLLMDPSEEYGEDILKLRIPSSRNVVKYIESLISPFCT